MYFQRNKLIVWVLAGQIVLLACLSVGVAKTAFSGEKGMPIISLLDQISTMSVENYDPTTIIKTVNALQSLGKEKALLQVSNYVKQADKNQIHYALFWVLRILFDLPKQLDFPTVVIGKPDIPPPDEMRKLPRYPIIIIDDVPLLVVRGYFLSGLPEPVDNHIEFFRSFGHLRKKSLMPTTSLQAVEKKFKQRLKEAYGAKYVAQALETVHGQLHRIEVPRN